MIVLEGRKRFYLISPKQEEKIKHWTDRGPIFTSKERVAEGRTLGLQVADLEAGELLYFPSHWYHEVHNLTPDSTAITNAVPWPKKDKNKEEDKNNEEEKNQKLLGKRCFEEVAREYFDYKFGVLE